MLLRVTTIGRHSGDMIQLKRNAVKCKVTQIVSSAKVSGVWLQEDLKWDYWIDHL